MPPLSEETKLGQLVLINRAAAQFDNVLPDVKNVGHDAPSGVYVLKGWEQGFYTELTPLGIGEEKPVPIVGDKTEILARIIIETRARIMTLADATVRAHLESENLITQNVVPRCMVNPVVTSSRLSTLKRAELVERDCLRSTWRLPPDAYSGNSSQ